MEVWSPIRNLIDELIRNIKRKAYQRGHEMALQTEKKMHREYHFNLKIHNE